IGPAIFEAGRRKLCFPSDAKVHRELLAHAPIVLREGGEVRPLLADEADGIEAAGIGPTKEQGREWITARGSEVGVPAAAGLGEAPCGETGQALASEAVVVSQLVHAAELERVRALHPREIVVEAVDSVLRAVVGAAAPTSVTVTEIEIQDVEVAIGHVRQA